MQITETTNQGLKRGYKLTIPAADIDARIAAELAKIAPTVRMPGFRPGKVPANLLRKMHGEQLHAQAIQEAIRESVDSLMKDKALVGEFSQAAVRSSAAILGVALNTNIYGNAGMVPMMVLSAVPFFNVYAVLILQFSPHTDENGRLIPPERNGAAAVRRALVNVVKNPIILGILLGVPFSLLRVKLPGILASTLSTIGGTATPVALLAVGASFSGSEAAKCMKPALAATAIKLFILPAIFLPIAALFGFTGSAMIAILILVGSPTTVSCYVMAKNMGHRGVLTSNVVMLATVLSSVSLTLWIFLLRLFGLL